MFTRRNVVFELLESFEELGKRGCRLHARLVTVLLELLDPLLFDVPARFEPLRQVKLGVDGFVLVGLGTDFLLIST